jgi:hypothetical protein
VSAQHARLRLRSRGHADYLGGAPRTTQRGRRTAFRLGVHASWCS